METIFDRLKHRTETLKEDWYSESEQRAYKNGMLYAMMVLTGEAEYQALHLELSAETIANAIAEAYRQFEEYDSK